MNKTFTAALSAVAIRALELNQSFDAAVSITAAACLADQKKTYVAKSGADYEDGDIACGEPGTSASLIELGFAAVGDCDNVIASVRMTFPDNNVLEQAGLWSNGETPASVTFDPRKTIFGVAALRLNKYLRTNYMLNTHKNSFTSTCCWPPN